VALTPGRAVDGTETHGTATADDATLVARAADADPRAWAELVARHGPVAWAVIRRSGLAGDDAADVYQTAWLAAVESLPSLRHPERFGGWLARTAAIQSLRVRRRYGITRRVLSKVPNDDVDERLPEEDLQSLEDRSRVARALGTIGGRCAALLRLLYYESPAPPYAEVGRRLSMPVGSIGPTRARCLARLAQRLGLSPEDSA